METLRISVKKDFFLLSAGKKGATKKRIETETRTRINIPRMGAQGENQDIVITSEVRIAESNP